MSDTDAGGKQTSEVSEAIEEVRESEGDRCIKLRRHGYEAYIRTTTPDTPAFSAVHKHYHEEDWRVEEPMDRHVRGDMERMRWSLVDVEETPFQNPDMEVPLDDAA